MVCQEGIEPSPGRAEYGFTVRCNLSQYLPLTQNLLRCSIQISTSLRRGAYWRLREQPSKEPLNEALLPILVQAMAKPEFG